MNENITIVLDQILEHLELIKKTVEKKETPTAEKDDSLTVLSERIRNIEEYGPIINKNIANFSSSFERLTDRINSYEPVNETKVEYNHVFFPGFQSWLHSLKRGTVVVILLFIISCLAFTSFYLWQKMEDRKDEYYKYYTMKYYGRSFDFADSLYSNNQVNLINKLDSLISSDEKEKKLKDELNKTADKYYQIQKELKNTN